MFKKIYLKRKYQKNAGDYLCLFVIMIVALMLIHFPSIFLDSETHGEEIHFQKLTDGYDIRLVNVQPNEADYFTKLKEITYRYKDGTLSISTGSAPDNSAILNEILQIKKENRLEHIEVTSINKDSFSVPSELITLITVVQIIFALIGMTALFFAYQLLLNRRKSEFDILIRLGIPKATLRNTLLCELLTVYLPAFLIAVLLSHLTMYLLLTTFFTETASTVWIIYDFSVGSVLWLLMLSLAAVGGAFFLSWRKLTQGLSGDYFEKEKRHRRLMNQKITAQKQSAKRFLIRTSLFRECDSTLPCLISTVITVTAAFVLLCFAGFVQFEVDREGPDVYVATELSQQFKRADEIEAAYAQLSALRGIGAVSAEADYTAFVTVLRSDSPYSIYATVQNCPYSHISIQAMSEAQVRQYGKPALYQALLPKGTDLSIFDSKKLALYPIATLYSAPNPIAELSVAGTLDMEMSGDWLYVYVSAETFEALVGHSPVITHASIAFDPSADREALMAQISEIFSDSSLFTVSDEYQRRMEGRQIDQMMGVMMTLFGVLMLACGAILIYVFSSLFAFGHQAAVKQLLRLGANPHTVMDSDIGTATVKGTAGAAIGLTAGAIILLLISRATDEYAVSFHLYWVLCALLLLAAVLLTHLIPVIRMTRKTVRKEL